MTLLATKTIVFCEQSRLNKRTSTNLGRSHRLPYDCAKKIKKSPSRPTLPAVRQLLAQGPQGPQGPQELVPAPYGPERWEL
jgi:hypothetical protein